MNLPAQLFLFSFMIKVGREECSNFWKMAILSIFLPFGFFLQAFEQFKPWILLNFADIVNFVSLILCSIVFCLYF